MEVTPEAPNEVHENSIISIIFDSPVTLGSGVIYLGNSVSVLTTPVPLTSAEGLVATFIMPAMPAGRVYLHVPAGAVQSNENFLENEDYRFNTNTFWTFVEGRRSPLSIKYSH